MKMKRIVSWMMAATLLVVCVAGGCGKGSGPKLYPVKGKVSYKGAPVDGANVMFRATDGNASGAGRTDANGVYQITSQWGAGLPEGEYLVGITKFEELPMTEDEEGPYNPQLADMEPPPPKSLIPTKYASPERSGLKASVSKSGGTFDFELTD
ncbi:MAG: carboxypeptidase-like regulatory domain-containing protein [Thermogutta sp.]